MCHVYYVRAICVPYVYRICTICVPYMCHMCIMCAICVPYVCHMCTICVPYVYATAKPRRRTEPARNVTASPTCDTLRRHESQYGVTSRSYVKRVFVLFRSIFSHFGPLCAVVGDRLFILCYAQRSLDTSFWTGSHHSATVGIKNSAVLCGWGCKKWKVQRSACVNIGAFSCFVLVRKYFLVHVYAVCWQKFRFEGGHISKYSVC